jgi:hypothetical protein
MPSLTIRLRREVIPATGASGEQTAIHHSPVFCGYCANLHGPSAEHLLPSFNVTLKRKHTAAKPSASVDERGEGPGEVHAPDPNAWEISVELTDVLRQAAEGCASCTLLQAAVELIMPPEFQVKDLGLTVEFREGCVLRGDVYSLLPEEERENEFAFGQGMVAGAVSGLFDRVISSFELYTLPRTSIKWWERVCLREWLELIGTQIHIVHGRPSGL